jgi:hypothetical protein
MRPGWLPRNQYTQRSTPFFKRPTEQNYSVIAGSHWQEHVGWIFLDGKRLMLVDLPYNVSLPVRWSIFGLSCSSRAATLEPDSFEINNCMK